MEILSKKTQNGVVLTTYKTQGISKITTLVSETRKVSFSESKRTGLWTITLEDKTREDVNGWNLLLRTYILQDLGFAMEYLDKKQHELGFFTKK